MYKILPMSPGYTPNL